MGRKGKETTPEERKLILAMRNEGKTFAEISRLFGRNESTIRSVYQRYKDAEDLTNKKRTGRPKVFNERDCRKIVSYVSKNPRATSSEIAAGMKQEVDKTVCNRTIRNVLKKAGYNARVARRKPLISKRNQLKRKTFAKDFINKDTSFWDNVMFTDESKYNIFESDGRSLVWRKSNTELELKNIKPTVKHGGGSVMVWGSMAASGVGNLVFIDGTMDKNLYLKILKENVKNSAEKLNIGKGFYFQQDNDPKHTAHVVREWLLYNVPHRLNTPPQSPDLNPIEHLWDDLEKRIRKHEIRNKQQLKAVLMDEWNKTSSEYTQKLVHSMPNRLKDVLNAKGLHTKY